eukprot:Nk52_evm1s2164 gene=Nk52_evmTU1s2164
MAQQHAGREGPAHQHDVLRGQRRAVLHDADRDEEEDDQQVADQGTQGTEHRPRVLAVGDGVHGPAAA